MKKQTPWVIAVGASGGEGLQDLCALLRELNHLKAIVMIVLHRRWDLVSHLREVLQRSTSMPVIIASEAQHLEPGSVYIGEPASHLTLVSDSLGGLTDDPLKRHRNRTVDLLFDSLAQAGGQRMVGVVLSGSLDDGSRGLEAIHEAGGRTMVLTPAGPRGMPQNAIDYDGPVDVIGDVAAIAVAIAEAVRRDLG